MLCVGKRQLQRLREAHVGLDRVQFVEVAVEDQLAVSVDRVPDGDILVLAVDLVDEGPHLLREQLDGHCEHRDARDAGQSRAETSVNRS